VVKGIQLVSLKAIAVVVLLVALIVGAYFFFSAKPVQPSMEMRIENVLQKYGLKSQDFNGTLLLDAASQTPQLKISQPDIAKLQQELDLMKNSSKSQSERELISFYARAIVLSNENFELLKNLNSLATNFNGQDLNALCGRMGEFSGLELGFNDYFVAASTLAYDISIFEQKYLRSVPFEIDAVLAGEQMDIISSIGSQLYSACSAEGVGA